jgi:hypothetical protein
MLFVGLSFADPNVRHVLSLIRESFTDGPPEHFAILKPPQIDEFKSKADFEARSIQHKLWAEDLKRYGLLAVEIDSYDEVPSLLSDLERRVARRRVWISGSWPPEHASAQSVYDVASGVGRAIGQMGLSLVTGAGLVVGSASVSGFLESLRESGAWDLERRLIARPFPQPLRGSRNPTDQWQVLRQELAHLAGPLVVIGGAKLQNSVLTPADGVREEVRIAQAAGSFLLPIGATGGAAEELARELRGSSIPRGEGPAWRPADDELDALSDGQKTPAELAAIASQIISKYRSK